MLCDVLKLVTESKETALSLELQNMTPAGRRTKLEALIQLVLKKSVEAQSSSRHYLRLDEIDSLSYLYLTFLIASIADASGVGSRKWEFSRGIERQEMTSLVIRNQVDVLIPLFQSVPRTGQGYRRESNQGDIDLVHAEVPALVQTRKLFVEVLVEAWSLTTDEDFADKCMNIALAEIGNGISGEQLAECVRKYDKNATRTRIERYLTNLWNPSSPYSKTYPVGQTLKMAWARSLSHEDVLTIIAQSAGAA